MIWTARYCSAKRQDGQPCGNPSSDGRGGLCGVHRRAAERRWREERERRLAGLQYAIDALSALRATLPAGHAEKPGVIRAIEVLRSADPIRAASQEPTPREGSQ